MDEILATTMLAFMLLSFKNNSLILLWRHQHHCIFTYLSESGLGHPDHYQNISNCLIKISSGIGSGDVSLSLSILIIKIQTEILIQVGHNYIL